MFSSFGYMQRSARISFLSELGVCMQHLSGYDLYFAMARGVPGTEALDMSKFFDTNYHYLVPELASTVSPKPDFSILVEKVCTDAGQSAILTCSRAAHAMLLSAM